jgi:hypothetical protein
MNPDLLEIDRALYFVAGALSFVAGIMLALVAYGFFMVPQ